mmetsp:Transcript_15446/g.17487  ORF Transcript_15446/g.17487 Transcript_15446/m.17487 type:complete len:419 (-) Transcript_15446:965-2221(-)|eukprot:CAMPEP_0184057046 /NCGR_PEP_ID=MMETSP0956-20121227/8189_1 /TAXON_ID=627963 /ORGANISM="Aplanochytrium sp, Strain PBS07" /LENGTH=418 /DNA_ID=CAMNT_0026351287 /DNA_START=37 /DNA_END=1293 /DNA_ORIENTATION=-
MSDIAIETPNGVKHVVEAEQASNVTEKNDKNLKSSGDEGENADQSAMKQTEASAAKKKKKKKKRNNMSKNKKERLRLEKWFQEVLENTKDLVDSVPEEERHVLPEAFYGYEFAGPLRPCAITKQVQVPENIAKPDYADDGIPHSELESEHRLNIHVHSPEEIEIMRDVCRIGREVLDIGGKFLKAGVTGDEIDRIIHAATIERGAYPSPLNYNNFPKSVCVSVNEIICHGIPDLRVIQDGDIVNLDVSVYKNGFHADLNETFMVGNVDEDSEKLVKTAYECLKVACEQIKPGFFYRDIGAFISSIAAKNGCTVVKTYCGHGIGRLFHTSPNVPHYKKNKGRGIMKAGHIFTIEPMINIGNSWADGLWPDNWSATTTNGNRSAQFEHTFLVTETGVEILTSRKGSPKDKLVWDPSAFKR